VPEPCNELLQPFELFGGETLDRKAARKAFEDGAYLVDLLDLNRAQLGDDRALMRNEGDEPLGVELPQSLAHRHAADFEFGCERLLVDLLAG
jgi:hypothetical protein